MLTVSYAQCSQKGTGSHAGSATLPYKIELHRFLACATKSCNGSKHIQVLCPLNIWDTAAACPAAIGNWPIIESQITSPHQHGGTKG